MRTERYHSNGTEYTYYYSGSQLARMVVLDGDVYGSYTFRYDANGMPLSMTYSVEVWVENGYWDDDGNYIDDSDYVYYDGTYYYVTNAQGDVIALTDESGNRMAAYTYDAWGKPLTTTYSGADYEVVEYNPLRYRGYVYDSETGLYYLQSRYYDPEIGRFINADGQMSGPGEELIGNNQFAYCFNNPVNLEDSTGGWPSLGKIFAAVATIAVAAVVVTAVVASAGAVGVAAGVIAASMGVSGSLISAAITVGTVGTYAVAAGIGICAASNAGEILTGTNVVRDVVMGGNQEAYNTTQTILGLAGSAALIAGQSIPNTSANGKTSTVSSPKHTSGVTSPKNISNPGGSYTQLDNNGSIYSYTEFDISGRQYMRIDFQGKPHAGVLPHIHIYVYPEQGGQVEYTFDLNWDLIG